MMELLSDDPDCWDEVVTIMRTAGDPGVDTDTVIALQVKLLRERGKLDVAAALKAFHRKGRTQ